MWKNDLVSWTAPYENHTDMITYLLTDKSSGPIISILSWGWMNCESRLEQLLHFCLAPTSFGLLKDIASVIFLSPASSSLLLDDFRNTQILLIFPTLKPNKPPHLYRPHFPLLIVSISLLSVLQNCAATSLHTLISLLPFFLHPLAIKASAPLLLRLLLECCWI